MALAIGAEAQPLDRRGAVADEGEHLLPGCRELHRPPAELRGQRGDDHGRLRRALRAEAASDVRRDHPHAVGIEAEDLGDRVSRARGALVGVVDGELAAFPARNRRVGLHRVVVLGGRLVGRVDRDLRAGERGVDVALVGLGRKARVDLLGRLELRVVVGELHVVLGGVVGDPDAARPLPRRLERIGDHRRDDLAAIGHVGRLEDEQLAVVDLFERRSVLVRQHLDDECRMRRCRRSGPSRSSTARSRRRRHPLTAARRRTSPRP